MSKSNQETAQTPPDSAPDIYKFDLQIILRMSTKNGAPSINMETDLNAPISLVLHAISHIKDSLLNMMKDKTHEELVSMVVRDIMPKPVMPKSEETPRAVIEAPGPKETEEPAKQ